MATPDQKISATRALRLLSHEILPLGGEFAYILEDGALDIFAVPLKDGEPCGPRRFLFSLSGGDVALWTRPFQGEAFGLIAIAMQECRLLTGPVREILEVISHGAAEKWVRQLTSVVVHVEGVPPEISSAGAGIEELFRVEDWFVKDLAERERAEDKARRERFEQRRQLDASIAKSAIGELASVTEATRQIAPLNSSNRLLQVLRVVGHAQGIVIKDAPLDEHGRDPVQILAEASGVRTRRVLLQAEWWKKEFGPFLAFLADTDHPVAVLPSRARFTSNRYELHDVVSGTRRPVDASVAAGISSFGYTLTSTLPASSRGADVLRFALSGSFRDIAMVLLCGVAATALGMLLPQATAIVIDYAIPDSNSGMLFDIALGLGAAALGGLLFEFAQAASLLRIETTGAAAVQSGVWDRLLKSRPDFFRKFATGDLHSRASAASAIRQRIGGITLSTLFAAGISFINAALMMYYSPSLAAVALVLAAAVAGFIMLSGIFIMRIMPSLQEIEGQLLGLMVQMIDAVPKLRVAGAEQRAFAHWAQTYSRKQRLNVSVFKLQDRIRLLNAVLPAFAPAAVYWAASGVIGTEGNLTLGTFLAFNTALGTFLAGITAFSETGVGLLNVASLWKRTRVILEAEPEVQWNAAYTIRLAGGVKLDNVSFRYRDEGPKTLDQVTIEARQGQCIALVGPSGSGKSTIVNLLLGFERPATGAIYYDGHDLKGLNVTAVRRQIGVVMQNNKIMAGSIFENIACGSLSTITDAWEAARAAGLADDIEQMPMGMHTVISEGGSNLSGGQRQRLLIGRALVLKPGVLILDEATSALDNRTQAIVMENLNSLNVTRIIVAHRLSTIRHADRIYVIDSGQVVQSGTYEELSRLPGLFATLMARQKA